MKPITLRFQCFGSFIEERTIHFDTLSRHGLFLICGETGSGKTTILDAVCCALYGSCSGEIRGSFADMRCRQADPDDPTEVEFIFECDGKRYRFIRRMVRHNSRDKNAPATYDEDYSCCVRQEEKWVPLMDKSSKKEMYKLAVRLIGLDLDQFRQVVILPQGKFETLLTSQSADKESILSSIFHTGRWQNALDVMNEELKKRNRELENDEQTIRDGCARLGASAVEELPEIRKNAEEKAKAAEKAEKAAGAEKEKADRLKELKKEFETLDRLQKEYDRTREAAKNDPGLKDRLEQAKKAETARRPYEDWKRAEKNHTEAKRQLSEAETSLRQAADRLKQAQEAKEAHEALSGENEKNITEKQRLGLLREIYQKITDQTAAAKKAGKLMEAEQKKSEAAGKELEAEQEKLTRRLTEWQEAGSEAHRLALAYQAATIGHLAAGLIKGEACPVCGSPEHPHPAVLPDDAVGSQEVEKAEDQVAACRKAYDAQVKVRDAKEKAAQKAKEDYTKAKSESEKAETVLQESLKQRDPELETLEALDERAGELSQKITAYENRRETLNGKLTTAQADCQAGEKRLQDKTKDAADTAEALENRKKDWEKALADTALETEERYLDSILSAEEQQRLTKTLAEHEAEMENAEKNLKEQKGRLAEKERPDMEAVDAVWNEAEEKYRTAIQQKAVAERKYDEIQKMAGILAELSKTVRDKREKFRSDAAFYQALQGSSGMSIQRYVLAVRLGQVVAEANRMLANIYGGRYRLHRSDEVHGTAHKSGLELDVYDSMNDQRRSVCTLSGGEKFLVSLSLAIGLCTVVQNERRGVNLEAMFIDEGFGSLDQNTLGDALDVLQSVQNGHGLVGIISHIQLLEETIPTKLIVEKGEHGSRISGPPGVIG